MKYALQWPSNKGAVQYIGSEDAARDAGKKTSG